MLRLETDISKLSITDIQDRLRELNKQFRGERYQREAEKNALYKTERTVLLDRRNLLDQAAKAARNRRQIIQ